MQCELFRIVYLRHSGNCNHRDLKNPSSRRERGERNSGQTYMLEIPLSTQRLPSVPALTMHLLFAVGFCS